MARVIRISGLLIFSLLWACWALSSALAQIEIDLGPQEVPTLKAEEPEAILGLAAQQMERGEAAVALATIAQGLARYPDDTRLLERQADIYAPPPFFRPQAAEIYRRLLAQRPGDLAVKNKLATTSLALLRLSQAEKLFYQVLAAEPDNAESRRSSSRGAASYPGINRDMAGPHSQAWVALTADPCQAQARNLTQFTLIFQVQVGNRVGNKKKRARSYDLTL